MPLGQGTTGFEESLKAKAHLLIHNHNLFWPEF